MKTKIYGASDDLLEMEGAISDELDCYGDAEEGLNVECSDGTKAVIKYEGDWNILLIQEGSLFEKVVNSNDELPHEDEDAKGCTTYSDVLVLKEGIEWISVNGEKFNA